ncbi:hypothetical protein VTK73DRAFT_10227 [Phialemonium thermophilum]|uniref:Cyclin N-terminal domain-containing protein n=1 Tax=Phialemonium thermophilum TaxID=223376 RepID=A0ABR3XH35_9PEZI
MDAKPYRPLRGVPLSNIGTTENRQSNHILHQRYKSVGNIKNLAANGSIGSTATVCGGLNIGPKRPVLVGQNVTLKPLGDGEVKEQVKERAATLSHDMMDKENIPLASEGFLRPAQRPFNYSAKQVVSIASTSTTYPPTTAATKPTAANAQTRAIDSQPHPTAKPSLTKRATVIFQDGQSDMDLASHAHTSPSSSQLPAVETQPIKSNDKQVVRNPRQYKSQPQLRVDQRAPVRTQSHQHLPKVDDLTPPFDDAATEDSYEDAVEHLPAAAEKPLGSEQSEIIEAVSVSTSTSVVVSGSQSSIVPNTGSSFTQVGDLAHMPRIPEPEEYWDDDDEEEYYDEQGYTTAHSYRSHGDNTTGGATTVLAPKITTKVLKELEMAKAIVESTLNEDDVEEEAWDVSMVAEYGDEIFEYMRDLETKSSMLPNRHYMDIQTELQWSMRSVLMDWLVQVHQRFSLLPETLFLAVNCIDRFLSVKVISLTKLQLVGATAILVAAKYEEINCPSVQEIVYMVDGGYTADEILKAERFMLSMLEFELGWPGPMSFLRRISKADDYDLETRTLAKYFLEVTIMDERFVGSPPSFLAAGAHCLARMMLRKGDWSPAHVHYSGYTLTQIKHLVALILQCCQDPRKHHNAVFEKYGSSKYQRASSFVEVEIKMGFAPSFMPNASRISQWSLEIPALTGYQNRDLACTIPIEG